MKLTFKDLPRPFWYRVGLLILFFSIFCMHAFTVKQHSYDLLGDILDTLGYLLATAFCLGKPGKSAQQKSFAPEDAPIVRPLQHWIPYFLALSCFCDALAIAMHTYANVFHIGIDFPSWPDVFFLISYLFLLIGVLCLPAGRHSATSRSRIVLDGLMIMTAIVTFSWYFILGPTVLQDEGSVIGNIVGGAYPAIDLLLVFCLLLLAARSGNSALGPIFVLLTAALALDVFGDSIYNYTALHGIRFIGNIRNYMVVDLIGVPAEMLIGLAAYALHWSHSQRALTASTQKAVAEATDERLPLWKAFLPYMFVPAIIVLAIFTLETGTYGPLEIGVYILSGLLMLLVLARQFFSIRETGLYAHHVQQLNTDLSHANARLEELATTDPLTKRPNHRTLVTLLDQELERANRYDRSCAILFMDIDHFKALNDGYGHGAGDTVLHDFAARVQASLRSIDTVGRWGGEEFVAVLPEVAAEDAYVIAERVRTAVAMKTFEVGGGLSLSCSIGIASYPLHEQTRATLLKAADKAMYGAKRLGRNQVRQADDPAILALSNDATEGGREEIALLGTVKALTDLVAARDSATSQRAQEVAVLITHLTSALGLSPEEAQMIVLVGQMYDIGKVAIPDAILRKADRLTDEEWAIVRTHSGIGADVISNIPALRPLAPIVRAHHERWDGQGYPDQLATTGIPLGARILAVVDSYMAMTMNRPYQQARTPLSALAEIQHCAGSQFDPHIVATLESALATIQDQQREKTIA
jgi:two-component system, cell cycle response regulator